MNKGRSILTYYTFNPVIKEVVAEYTIGQNNGETSIEQKMVLEGSNIGHNTEIWNATIILDDFSSQKTPEAAAHKLADWLERLATGIRSGEYNLPSHSTEYEDFDDVDEEPFTD